MSTQLDSPRDDLDRTDELPQLDVAAYEASLAEKQQGLSRTDTWTVGALQDMDELAESAHSAAPTSFRNAGGENVDAAALTINVQGILQRIAELEADILAGHEANAALQKRSEAIQADRNQQALRIRALEAENARLGEHRALADEMVQRLEKQLREQSQRADAELKTLQATRSAEQLRSDQEREGLQHRIAQMAARSAALQEGNRALQDQLHASMAASDQRAESLAALEKSLSDEKTSTARLARHLAAKLKDCEMLASAVDLRNRTIDELTRARDDLSQGLQRETASGIQLAAQLVVAEQSLHANHAILLGHEHAIAEKDQQLAQLTTDLDRTAGELESARQKHEAASLSLSALDTAHSQSLSELSQRLAEIGALRTSLQAAERRETEIQKELSAALLATTDEDRRRLELEARLQEAQQSIIVLSSERDAAQAQIRSLSEERDALLPASAQLDALTAEFSKREVATRALEHALQKRDELVEELMGRLQAARDERAIMAGQVDKAQTRVKSLTQHIFSRDNQIAELQADLAVHTEALAAIRRDVNRIGENADAESDDDVEHILEPIEHAGEPIVLTGRILTLGRTSENDISIPSKLVSRHHARLLMGPTGVIIEDAGSTNGCFVNGEQVRQHLMHEGDVLELGDMRYCLRTRSTRDTKIRANVVPIFDGRRADD